MSTSILRTKLYPPPLRPDGVSRLHLVERFKRHQHGKITVIAAPAGFGKSTLASEFVKHSRQAVSWLSLDEGDRDPARFLIYLIASLQTIFPAMGTNLLTQLQGAQSPPPQTILSSLLNEMSSHSDGGIVILDDYHVLDSLVIDDLLNFLLDYLPPQYHIVVVTREDPNLPLARLRARGQLAEFRAADLRFTIDESREFLNQSMGLDLSNDEIKALESRTEGWVAGLQLAALSLQRQGDTRGFIENFTGSHHFVLDYLLEEALQQQAVELQDFLLNTSMLDRLDASLCGALMGIPEHEAQQRLTQIEQANLFVIPLDETRRWYRYHHLFADVLQARLNSLHPERLTALHHRASQWFEQAVSYTDAIKHAMLANDGERVADLIELAWPQADRYVQFAPWLGWLKSLPQEIFANRPVLQNIYVWALIDVGELENAESRLDNLMNWATQNQRQDSLVEPPPLDVRVVDLNQYQRLLWSMYSAKGYIAQTNGNLDRAIEYHQRSRQLHPVREEIECLSADGLYALALLSAGEVDKAYTIFSEGIEVMRKAGTLGYAIGVSMLVTDLKLNQGKLLDTRSLIDRFKQYLPEQRPYPQGAIYIFIAEAKLYLAWNDLDAAEQAIAMAESVDQDSPLVLGHYRLLLLKARLQQARGDLKDALDFLQQAEKLYYRNVVPEFHPVATQKARLLIKQGQLKEAWVWVHEQELAHDNDILFLQEYDFLTLARLLIASARAEDSASGMAEAAGLLARLESIAQDGQRNLSLIDTLILQSLLLESQNNSDAALIKLEQAIDLAMPENQLDLFIAEGQQLAPLLTQLNASGVKTEFVASLIKAIGISSEPENSSVTKHDGLIEPLSKREKQVLELIAEGFSNQEISEKLFLALSSVKGHNQRIFGKLQVQRRTEAVAKAREFELI